MTIHFQGYMLFGLSVLRCKINGSGPNGLESRVCSFGPILKNDSMSPSLIGPDKSVDNYFFIFLFFILLAFLMNYELLSNKFDFR